MSDNHFSVDFGAVNVKSLILTNDKELYEKLKTQSNIGVLFEPSVLNENKSNNITDFYLIGIQEDIQGLRLYPKSD